MIYDNYFHIPQGKSEIFCRNFLASAIFLQFIHTFTACYLRFYLVFDFQKLYDIVVWLYPFK